MRLLTLLPICNITNRYGSTGLHESRAEEAFGIAPFSEHVERNRDSASGLAPSKVIVNSANPAEAFVKDVHCDLCVIASERTDIFLYPPQCFPF